MRRKFNTLICLLLLASLLTGAAEKAFAEGPNQKHNHREQQNANGVAGAEAISKTL